ncbi:hypothetical protein RJT34_06502 [Clitoria ternatea]|uniref:Uncharacterized protein n=1 Tax=Clitoria ternatea TaxID=43366 RepID=A0AAN9PRS8_CLITE
MSLNCLTCSQLLQRTDSFRELFMENNDCTEMYKQVDRSWSPPSQTDIPKTSELPKGGPLTKVKVEHRRALSFGNLPSFRNSEPELPKDCELPKSGAISKVKAEHRRAHSTGNVPYDSEPKLIRSSGMRRDWSFENLAENQDQRVSCR